MEFGWLKYLSDAGNRGGEMEKPYVGQTVYSLNIGNAARNREQVLTEYRVVGVGRKYFTIQRHDSTGNIGKIQFTINDWRQNTNYCEDHCLYTSRQDYEDEKESNDICRQLGDAFKYSHNNLKIGLDRLRKIAKILKGED